jgi:hypothetical protein
MGASVTAIKETKLNELQKTEREDCHECDSGEYYIYADRHGTELKNNSDKPVKVATYKKAMGGDWVLQEHLVWDIPAKQGRKADSDMDVLKGAAYRANFYSDGEYKGSFTLVAHLDKWGTATEWEKLGPGEVDYAFAKPQDQVAGGGKLEKKKPVSSRVYWKRVGQCLPGQEISLTETQSVSLGVKEFSEKGSSSSTDSKAAAEVGGDYLGGKASAEVSVGATLKFGESIEKNMMTSTSTSFTDKQTNSKDSTMVIFQLVIEVEYEDGTLREVGTQAKDCAWHATGESDLPEQSPEEALRQLTGM